MEDIEEFRYILVGNIIGKHFYGENKEIVEGTKHFRAGAKVYLFPEYGGMAHERIPVFGLPKKSYKKVMVVIPSILIKDVRIKKTFDTELIEKVDCCYFYEKEGFKNLDRFNRFAEYLNSNHVELK
ncbi:hypothetical protein [Flavobacterium sp.]|uniref:hypothetical protein n=1 Tax=Flavobacterium sp. TaxID=239 RepID=UPI0031D8913B